jgi:carbonic anhydrase
MEVSLAQLNTLALEVSGMDSSVHTVAAPPTWKDQLPVYAVDKDNSTCNTSDATNYNYDFVHCWAEYHHLPGDIENHCGSTEHASPIDIKTDTLAGTGSDDFLSRVNWKPMSGLTVDVHNHASLTVSTLYDRLGYSMLYDAKEGGFPGFYQITNLTVHMPSEHTVDGKHFTGELQVHMSKQFTDFDLATDDALAASFFFQVGEESILMGQILDAAEDTDHGHAMGTLDLMQTLGPHMDPTNGGDFYSYSGSFTTPDLGCAPVVKWFVFTSPMMSMSVKQVEQFRKLVPSPGNNRPIQNVVSPDIYKNSFQEGTLPTYDFYLSRTEGRDRVKKGTGMILLPVFGSVILAIAVMFATFNHQDNKTKKKNAGGLIEESIGNASERI